MSAAIRTSAIALAGLIALGAGAAGAAPLQVTGQQIVHKTAEHDIAILYPRTGVAAIDTAIASWAKHEAEEFAGYARDARPKDQGRPWSLAITPKIVRNDDRMFEALLSGRMNDDGNHTHFAFLTFNFRLPGAQRVSIADVVVPAAYARMRAYAVAHMVSEDPDFGAEVADGALAPVPASFAAFTISPSAITVWFTPEKLGNMTSAGGHAVIPLSELKGLLRPGWTAP